MLVPSLVASKTVCAQSARSIARPKRMKLASEIPESPAATPDVGSDVCQQTFREPMAFSGQVACGQAPLVVEPRFELPLRSGHCFRFEMLGVAQYNELESSVQQTRSFHPCKSFSCRLENDNFDAADRTGYCGWLCECFRQPIPVLLSLAKTHRAGWRKR